MLELQFKSIGRLNRVLAVAFIVFTLEAAQQEPSVWGAPLLTTLGLVHLGFLMGNEFFLKMAKRLRGAESQTVMHLGVFLPFVFALYAWTQYFLTGNGLIYLLGLFVILEALLLGQPKVAKILGAVHGIVFVAGLPWGYPHEVSFGGIALFLVSAVWGTCLYYYGSLVLKILRSHTSEVGKLQSMAATDALTGLTNRRQFNVRLHEEVARARRHEASLALALFDLDDFKHLNDFYGHPVGDRILRELGKLIRQNIRESDLSARYGGEEFALILPETREAEAAELLERIRMTVAQTVFCLPDNPLTITISVGVAQLDPRYHTSFELVELADKALYEAKRQGKNRVIKASALTPKVLLSKHSIQL